MLEKIVYAGTVSRSFAEASQLLDKLAGLEVDEKQVERVARATGEERVRERNVAVEAFQKLPLAEKFTVPKNVTAPDLGVVMVDGGRMQILDRSRRDREGAGVAETDDGVEEAWETETRESKGHWREDKVGLLMTMESSESTADPCPELPESFVDVTRIPRLVREIKRNVKHTEEAVADTEEPEVAEQALSEATVYEPPEVAQRQVVASRCSWPEFAVLMAQAAHQAGFQGAARKAFVADGSSNNWVMQRRFFASSVPILDFIHALTYVFASATAGRTFQEGWPIYQQWITWVWQGQVNKVIAALTERQAGLGKPVADEAETSPRNVVNKALTYLSNHQDKMHYAQYRQAGLPLTSSHMESMVKQVNMRVKGTEKFWSEEGGEAILQLRADHLSDDEPMTAFWKRRQASATGQRNRRAC